MSMQPALRLNPASRSDAWRWVLRLALLVALLPTLGCRCIAAPAQPTFVPRVIVLVLGGLGSSEQSSIEYDSAVALPAAQADLNAIAEMGNWKVVDAKGVTKVSGPANSKPSTSISFMAKGMIGYSDGTLPLEPFVDALKRYKFIEVDYIAPSTFPFSGLRDFDNRYVSVHLDQSGTSYRYRITVRDAGFKKLNLPPRQPRAPKAQPRQAPTVFPFVLALLLATGAGVLVYLVVSYLLKKGKSNES